MPPTTDSLRTTPHPASPRWGEAPGAPSPSGGGPGRGRAPRLRHPFGRFDPLLLLLLGTVVLAAPLSVIDAAWVDHLDPLPWLAVGGLLIGFLLARSAAPPFLAHLIGPLLGLEALLYAYATRAAPTGDLSERVEWLLGRVGTWLAAVINAGATGDPLLFAVTMALLAWLLGYSSAWLLFRAHAPWLAITTNGLALLMNLSYAPAALGSGYVTWFLLTGLLLVASHHTAQRQEVWRFTRMRVEPLAAAKLLLGSAVVGVVAVLAAWAVPSGVANAAVARGWDRLTAPWQELERDFDRLFAALNPSDRAARGLTFSQTLAPRGSFELPDTPVLEIRSPIPRYWRATTADRYTGGAITSSQTTSFPVAPGAKTVPDDERPLERVESQATVKLLASRSGVAFAPDLPLRFSVPVDVEVRAAPRDIAGVRLATSLLRNEWFDVVSLATNASVQQLRAAGEDYPAWVRERYLQLPSSLPGRVRLQAAEVTRGATNPLDKGLAIEQYLRNNFTYSTRVPQVPADRDWVDYLLFESGVGYCDFFATAMVVMLRTQGVPARVATGFAPGEFDPASQTWLVRESHAHSWVEAYFPRYGWITFEPSAIRPVPERHESAAPAPTALPTQPARTDLPPAAQLNPEEEEELNQLTSGLRETASVLPTWAVVTLSVFGAGLVLLLVTSVVLVIAWQRGHRHLTVHQRPFAQLVRLAEWLRIVRPAPSHTPYEMADALEREAPYARPTIRSLADAYVEGTYGARPPSAEPWSAWLVARRDLARQFLRQRAARLFRRPRRG